MLFRATSAAVVLVCVSLSRCTHAFSPKSMRNRAFAGRPTTALGLRVNSDDDAVALMLAARECAHSDTCSVEEAQTYLRRVVEVQSGCVMGDVMTADACEDPAFTSDIIGELRRKIEMGAEVSSRTFLAGRQAELEKLVVASTGSKGTTLSPVAALTQTDLKLAFLAFAALYGTLLLSSTGHGGQGVEPFTAQEWWWAIKGGYLDNMVAHFVRNGGL